MLEKYADKSWHDWAEKYHRGEINVGEFNARVFSMMKVPKEELIAFTRQHAQLRAGFRELLQFCQKKNKEGPEAPIEAGAKGEVIQ